MREIEIWSSWVVSPNGIILVDERVVARRNPDGVYTAGPPPGGRSIDEVLAEIARAPKPKKVPKKKGRPRRAVGTMTRGRQQLRESIAAKFRRPESPAGEGADGRAPGSDGLAQDASTSDRNDLG